MQQETILKEFGIRGDELRVYLHYQPSYYHLHVHFTHINYTAPKTLVGEAHLLQEVIDNIQLANDYYQKKTISFCVKESSPLWREFVESNGPRDSYFQLSVQWWWQTSSATVEMLFMMTMDIVALYYTFDLALVI